MRNRDFTTWLSDFRDSITDYKYYIDFEKVHRNVESIKVELNILNSLIGSKNIEADFEALIEKYPEILKYISLRNQICRQNSIKYLCVKQDCLI